MLLFESADGQVDGLIQVVGRFVRDVLKDQQGVGPFEIEAKFGLFIDKGTNERIRLPILSEAVLDPSGGWYRFESNMPASLHNLMNRLLNQRTESSANPNNLPINTTAKMYYRKSETIDSFFWDGTRKIRVTQQQQSKDVEAMEKRRLGDLAIHFPNGPFDVRISINQEIPVEWNQSTAIRAKPLNSRSKNRRSYTCQSMQVDLTRVEMFDNNKSDPTWIMHELEVEVLEPQRMLSDPSLTESFVRCIREIVNSATTTQEQ